MAGSKPSIGSTEPRLGGLRVQTSLYGQTIAVVYGRTRIPGNLLWHGPLNAVRQEERSEAAKGGGSRPSRIYYEYSASVAMLLGEGPFAAVRTVYKGKQRFAGTASTTTQGTAQHEATVPAVPPYTVTVPSSSTWAADAGVVIPASAGDLFAMLGGMQTFDAPLTPGVDYSASAGVYTFNAAQAGKPVRITYTTSTTTPGLDALAQLGLALSAGTPNQPTWQLLSNSFPTEAVPYASLAYIRGQDYALTTSAEVENHTFEVDGFLGETANGDARPWRVIRDMLTNNRYGRGWPSAYIGDWSSYAAYCDAYSLFISPAFTEQRPLRDWLTDLLDATNTDAVWTGSVLKLIPRGDENAGSYVAPTTPVYDLGIDDFETDDGKMPVRVTRTGQQDTPNTVRVEYANRGTLSAPRDYNYETVTAEDEADIAIYGRVAENALAWHFFTESSSAKSAAFLRLQRLRTARRRYAFVLPWRFADLEPGDLVTLTDSWLRLSRLPVRIVQISENAAGDFNVEAEDFPIGHATAPIVAPQLGSGFRPDFNADPGNVATPMFIEPPGGYTQSGLEVWVALSGQAGTPGQYWGGAEVYASLDGGNSYKLVGRVDQGARFGTLTAPLAAGASAVLDVTLAGRGGRLRSVSPAEADALATLAFVGDTATGEFLAFESAGLTGVNSYRIATLRRGKFGTVDAAAAAGAQFVYVDGALAMSGALPTDMIGKTVWFKFCSFNVFGGGLQSLSSVTPYSYTVTGRFRNQAAVALSANRLENASFTRSTAGWTAFASNAPATFEPEPAFRLDGVAANARLTVQDAGTSGAGVIVSKLISVQPGQTYVAFASLVAFNTKACVTIAWFDANRVFVGYSNNSPDVVPRAGQNVASREDYTLTHTFSRAPANARFAQFWLTAYGWVETGWKYVWVIEPFLGLVNTTAAGLPAWDPGGANTGTLLKVGKRTDVLAVGVKGGVLTTHTLLDEASLPGGDLQIDVTGLMNMTAGTGGNAMGGTALYVTVNGARTTVEGGRTPLAFNVGAGQPVIGQIAQAYALNDFPGGSLKVEIVGVNYQALDNTTANMTDLVCRAQITF